MARNSRKSTGVPEKQLPSRLVLCLLALWSGLQGHLNWASVSYISFTCAFLALIRKISALRELLQIWYSHAGVFTFAWLAYYSWTAFDWHLHHTLMLMLVIGEMQSQYAQVHIRSIKCQNIWKVCQSKSGVMCLNSIKDNQYILI